jgi:RNA polymerase sigma-70 factor, ECF subfamily
LAGLAFHVKLNCYNINDEKTKSRLKSEPVPAKLLCGTSTREAEGTSMLKRTNEQWLADLRASGEVHETALADLREIILSGLPAVLSGWLSPNSPHYNHLAEEVAQETLLKVLSHLDTFEGRSQFTTWVYKIAVRIALTELRRNRWKDVSLESLLEPEEGAAEPQFMTDSSASPETQVMQTDLMLRIQRIMKEELSERQMLSMKLIAIHRMPMEEVARHLGSERNAVYKMMHDARLRLKHRLAREGMEVGEILAIFEAK